jgi:hypothetical protein
LMTAVMSFIVFLLDADACGDHSPPMEKFFFTPKTMA